MRCEKGGLKANAVEAGEHARGCGLLAEPRGPQRPMFSALRLFDAARGDVAVYIGGCYGGINLAGVPVNRRGKFLGVRVQHPNFTFSNYHFTYSSRAQFTSIGARRGENSTDEQEGFSPRKAGELHT